MYQCEKCGYDCHGTRESAINCCNRLPSILQLQADPFPTELQYVPDDKEIAEQGFIEQDASAPIKEQCEENARLMRRIASLEETNRELRILVLDWQETAIAAEQKAKKYEEAFTKMAECMHDLKG